jgi:hypothetical protein
MCVAVIVLLLGSESKVSDSVLSYGFGGYLGFAILVGCEKKEEGEGAKDFMDGSGGQFPFELAGSTYQFSLNL